MKTEHFEGDGYNEEKVHHFIQTSLPHLIPALHEELTAFLCGAIPITAITEQCREILKKPEVKRATKAITDCQLNFIQRQFQIVENVYIHEMDQTEQLIFRVCPELSQDAIQMLVRYIIAYNYNLPVRQQDQEIIEKFLPEDPVPYHLFLLLTKQMTLEKFIEAHGNILQDNKKDDFES